MSLLTDLLPAFQFSERHDILVDCNAARVLDIVQDYEPPEDRLMSLMMRAREIPGQWLFKLGLLDSPTLPGFSFSDFIPLGREGDQEIVAGLVGRFWRLDFGLVPVADAEAFMAFQTPGCAKLVVGFTAQPENMATRLVTETRVYCPDFYSWIRFAPYWGMIHLVSGWMRHRTLKAIKVLAERNPTAPA